MAASALFRAVEIEGFRGFGAPLRLEIDASAVIVVGRNGTGKTSFFDALQWLLLGSLPRLGVHANRRSDDYVINHWSERKVASVGADLWVDGHRVYARRQGTAEHSTLELHDQNGVLAGEEAQRRLDSLFLKRDEISLQEAMRTSGLLQQDAFRAVMEDEPKRRYAHLVQLLGLERLPGIEEAARSIAAASAQEARELRAQLDKTEAEHRNAVREFEGNRKEIEAAPDIHLMLEEIATRLAAEAPALIISGGLPIDGGALSQIGADARRCRERAGELIATGRRLDNGAVDPEIDLSDRLAQATEQTSLLLEKYAAAESELQAAVEGLQEEERLSDQLAQLAALAIPLLGERCPVCRQSIEGDEVRQSLSELLSREGNELLRLRTTVRDATDARLRADQALQAATKERNTLLEEVARLERRREELRDWRSACAALAEGAGSLRPADGAGVTQGNPAALEALRRAAVEVERAARETAAALAVPELTGRLEQLRTRVEQLTSDASHLRQAVAAASRRASEDRRLARATTQAITSLTRRRFELLAPLVTELYSRLDPHPAFTRLDYALDVYYQRPVADPVVIDEEWGIRADPLLVFSASQANVAALTFFLAMSWTAGTNALPFLLLDDPLQAMDDINALGFADLCRHIRGARQLVVSTHDKRLGGLLERKLAPRSPGERTRILRFVGWDRSGPQVEQELVEPQLEEATRLMLLDAA